MITDPPTEQVRGLVSLGLEELRAEWGRRYGAVPRLRSPDLLRRLLAWRIQSETYGGLAPETRRALIRMSPPRQRPAMAVGDRFTREWKGQRHEVEITDGGIAYRGAVYASLSQVARLITGVRWNGPRFFGLRGEDPA